MSKADQAPDQDFRIPPPSPTMGYSLDVRSPLHQLFSRRMAKNRDLKIIITSKNSQTGTGKTTLAFYLADQWHSIHTGENWSADEHATLDVSTYLQQYRKLDPGSVLIMDEAEQLDARRSMKQENVDFSHYWMMMRVRQVVSILTLPGVSALDSRLQELADVWIEVTRRGHAHVHFLSMNSYNQTLYTPKVASVEWPNVANHPEMQRLDEMKQAKIDRSLRQLKEEEETKDPEEAQRETKIEIAQQARENGLSCNDAAKMVGMSKGWVVENTETPEA